MGRQNFLSAIYLLIFNENNEVLLQRRQGSKLWPGFLALPAGHVDEGENVYDAAIREAKEELDITITLDSIDDTFLVNRRNKSLQPYFDVYFKIGSYKGTIKINEPEKCSEIKWVDINNLPSDMIDFEIDAIKNWKNNIRFSTIDVDNEKTL